MGVRSKDQCRYIGDDGKRCRKRATEHNRCPKHPIETQPEKSVGSRAWNSWNKIGQALTPLALMMSLYQGAAVPVPPDQVIIRFDDRRDDEEKKENRYNIKIGEDGLPFNFDNTTIENLRLLGSKVGTIQDSLKQLHSADLSEEEYTLIFRYTQGEIVNLLDEMNPNARILFNKNYDDVTCFAFDTFKPAKEKKEG